MSRGAVAQGREGKERAPAVPAPQPQASSRGGGEGREGEGEDSLIYMGPEGKPGGESRFPFSLKTDGVLKYKVIPPQKKVPPAFHESTTPFGPLRPAPPCVIYFIIIFVGGPLVR